jgi:hypothetical protein
MILDFFLNKFSLYLIIAYLDPIEDLRVVLCFPIVHGVIKTAYNFQAQLPGKQNAFIP